MSYLKKKKKKDVRRSLIGKKQLRLEAGMWLPVVRRLRESVAVGLENVAGCNCDSLRRVRV